MMRQTQDVPARATRREWIGLGVIALPCVLYSMDLTVLHLAVPSLSADLQPTSTQLLWIVDIYGFLLAGLLIPMGTLGDRVGRRRLLLIGAGLFGAASVLAALATSAGMLIATRAVLGIAGATLAPSTLSLIRNMFLDPGQRTVAIGIWITSYSVGAAIGPPLGGVLLHYFWWGSVFLVAVPVMLLLLALGPILLPEFRDPGSGRLDLTSAAQSLLAVLAAIYGLKRSAEHGPDGPAALAIVAGVALGAAFLRRQRTLADPLLDLRLFREPAFSAALATYTLGTFVSFGAYLFIAQYLQAVLGLSPLAAGVWSIPYPLGFVVGSMLTPRLVRRVRPAFVMAGGLLLATLGFAMLARIAGTGGLPGIVAATVIFALGLAPAFTLATDLVVGSAPPERAGAAAAISETSSELGGALGIAILGTVGAAVYRTTMAVAAPAGVPPHALAVARNTVGGALEIAGGLPHDVGAGLLVAAREAFTRSLVLTALICAGIAIATAVVAAVLLRRVGVDAGAAAAPADG